MNDPRTQLVADCYDEIGEQFAVWRERIAGDPRREWEGELSARLDDGARVLELGCGPGTPETRRLASRFRLTGVDISPRQVERARAALPAAEFVCADFTVLDLPPKSFDVLSGFGVSDTDCWTGEFLGAETFFSSFPAQLNSRLVREAGFEPVRDEVIHFDEPEGPASFQWVLAERR